jgi:hypothetical protein
LSPLAAETVSVRRAAPEVPIVGAFDADPVALGLFQGYARPGAMVTGLTLIAGAEQTGKNFEIMRDLVPRGVSFMFSPDLPGAVRNEPIARAAVEHLGLAFGARADEVIE